MSRIGTLTVALTLLSCLAGAQSPAAPSAPDSIPQVNPPETIATMKTMLRTLGAAGAGAGQAKAEVIAAGSSGWSAVARHPALKGRTCVIFVGNGQTLVSDADQKLRSASEGAPACDAP
jgi:hypothetical protein